MRESPLRPLPASVGRSHAERSKIASVVVFIRPWYDGAIGSADGL